MLKCKKCSEKNSDFAIMCNRCGGGLGDDIPHPMDEIINELNKVDNEGTRAPYWLILDPKQNLSCDVHILANQISGPFFSRKSAQAYLDSKKHHYSDRAVVYCHSGHFSKKYENLCKELEV